MAKAASCSYTNFSIGTEYVAVEANTTTGEYRYVASPILCNGSGTIVYDPGTGFSDGYDMGWRVPADFLASVRAGAGSNYRIFASGCNTHILLVNKYGPSNKTIDGISMAAYPIRSAPYIGIYPKPVYQKLGINFAMAQDPATNACLLRTDSGQNAGPGKGAVSCNGTNPINPAWRGNKFQPERDYLSGGMETLGYTRYYNSRAARVAGLSPIAADSAVAGVWTHNYRRSVQLFVAPDTTGVNTVQSAAVSRPDGSIIVFRPSGANWVAAQSYTTEKLARLATNGWLFVNNDDETETFDPAGKLVGITRRDGLANTLSYDINGRLQQVADPFGRALALTYDGSGRLATLTGADGALTQYGYTGNNLTAVTYPGGLVKNYLYENASYPAALTGIQDEETQRYATYTYDAQGRAYVSEHGSTGSGIDRHAITYNANGSATITDPLGSARTYTYQDQFETAKLAGSTQPAGSGCAAAAQAISYSSSGFVQTRTDFNGNQTQYTHNARGLETQRIEASGTPLARTISTNWHAYWRLPVKSAEPKKLTTYVYNGDTYNSSVVTCAPTTATVPTATGTQPIGVLCQKIEQATTDPTGSQGFSATPTGTARIHTYTYTNYGQVLTMDGPRTDLADITTITYYPTTDPSPGKRGNPATHTNALGHQTQITAYDANSRPLTLIDPNGTTLAFTYTPRGWLATSSIGGQTTTYLYDNIGQLDSVTRPDGSKTSYTYDPAHRLTAITDLKGNSANFTLDALGNVTQTAWINPDNTPAKTQAGAYDALGRLQAAIATRNAINYTTGYGYDANGNPKTTTDPKNQTTSTQYDALNRPTRITDALTGLTTLAYDARDQLTQFNAPNNAQTHFTVDGLGNVSNETSADRGNLAATHDAVGNLLTLSDARGVIETHTYDALNRPLTITYPATGENLATTWDSAPGCANGIGRPCRITDNGGSTLFSYDARGNRVSETRSEGSLTLPATQYTWDSADRLSTEITPTGKLLVTQRDTDGRIQQLSTAVGTNPQVNLVSAVQQNAAGAVITQTYGNGVTQTRTFNTDGTPLTQSETPPTGGGNLDGDVPTLPEWGALLLGALLLLIGYRKQPGSTGIAHRLTSLVLTTLLVLPLLSTAPAQADETLTYDPNGNIQTRTLPGGATTYGYDALDRLTSETGPAKTQTLTYDPNANRLSDSTGSKTYTTNTNRLLTENGQSFTLDATGNITQARGLTFVWNQRAGQLKTVSQGSTLLATYFYDYQGRRTRKITTASAPQGAGTVIYTCDLYDRLKGELDGAGNPQRTYVWRDEVPVSIIVHGTPEAAWYLEVEHLNTPLAARDPTGKIIWRWEADAFGSTQPNEDPDGDTQTTTINLRYPGQYYDKESGLHYNHRRYYDPKLGRYLSPDPIGLAGGANLYGYAKFNPLSYIDPDGNSPVLAVALGAAAAFYLGMDQLSSILQAKWKFDQLQQLQELKNTQLGACMNFPQGGGCGGGQQTERAINQCARESVPAASNAGYSPVPGPLDKALELLKRTAK
ncbi:MAG: hypothetical protein IV084_05510 [Rugosibacter sp.]|nr:hypothetical protein [Rugosibacter sp.]